MVRQNQYLDIFDDGYEVDTIIKNITYKNPNIKIIPGNTLIFFDEIQVNPNVVTSLKSFNKDKRFDVICFGSLMGLNYREIESNSVGNKIDYDMKSFDFEKFLWAKGYNPSQIEDMYLCLKEMCPLPNSLF